MHRKERLYHKSMPLSGGAERRNMSGIEAMAVLVREVRKRKDEAKPFPEAEEEALTEAMQMGVTALRILSQWEDYVVLGEEEE